MQLEKNSIHIERSYLLRALPYSYWYELCYDDRWPVNAELK